MTVRQRINGTDFLFEVTHYDTADGDQTEERFSTLTGALLRMQALRDRKQFGSMRVIGHDDTFTVGRLFFDHELDGSASE